MGPLPRKKYFCPQNDKFWCILMQFLTGRKHGQSLEALGHGFYCSIVKRRIQKQCKNYPKIHGQTKGGTIAPTWIRHCLMLLQWVSPADLCIVFRSLKSRDPPGASVATESIGLLNFCTVSSEKKRYKVKWSVTVVQGHSRLSELVRIDSPYTLACLQ